MAEGGSDDPYVFTYTTPHIFMRPASVRALANDRENGDIVFLVGERRIRAHRHVLVSGNEYFAAMLSGNFDEGRNPEMPIQEVDAEIFETIIQFCYTGVARITTQNIEELLRVSHRMRVLDLVDGCGAFLFNQLEIPNCLGVYYLAKFLHLRVLSKAAFQTACRNFVQVSACDEFLSSRPEQLLDLLTSCELVVSSEEEVFRAVMAWLLHDQSRYPLAEQMLMMVRLTKLSPAVIINEIQPLMRSPSGVREIYNTLQWIEDEAARWVLRLSTTLGPRRKKERENLFMVANADDGNVEISVFIPARDEWRDVAWFDYRRGFGCTRLGNRFIIAGGTHPDNSRNLTVKSYHMKTAEVIDLAPMLFHKSFFNFEEMNGKLYALGGKQPGTSCEKELQCYDPITNTWRALRPIPISSRHTMLTAVLNGLLYVYTDTNQLLAYYPGYDEWRMKTKLSGVRTSKSLSVDNGFLYLIGENPNDSTFDLNDPDFNDFYEESSSATAHGNFLWRYEPRHDRWSKNFVDPFGTLSIIIVFAYLNKLFLR